MLFVEAWLSLVEHRVRDAGVAGSNPVASIKAGNTGIWLMDISVARFLYVKIMAAKERQFFSQKGMNHNGSVGKDQRSFHVKNILPPNFGVLPKETRIF